MTLGGQHSAGRGRSLSVVENSEVSGEVGLALRKARAAQMAIPEGEVEDENDNNNNEDNNNDNHRWRMRME